MITRNNGRDPVLAVKAGRGTDIRPSAVAE